MVNSLDDLVVAVDANAIEPAAALAILMTFGFKLFILRTDEAALDARFPS